MKVLITGGTGFVGSWMCRSMPQGIGLHIDILNRAGYNLKWWWSAQKWDAVVHLANVPPGPALACAEFSHCRLLYVSSGGVYHEHPDQYDLNKRAWEVECLNSGAEVVIARPFTFYGEGLDEHKAIVQFIRAAKEGKPIRIWGDGNTVRTYMHGAEMGKWLWAILFRGKAGEAYDVGDDKPVTILQLARMVNRRYGNKSQIVIEGRAERVPYYVPQGLEKTRRLIAETDMNWLDHFRKRHKSMV